jgi:hypothetical protein
MEQVGIPGSFVSRHGRAKLEYLVYATTTGKQGKQTTSAIFTLLPSQVISVGICQYNLNIDLNKNGATIPLTAPIRNIVTVLVISFTLPIL